MKFLAAWQFLTAIPVPWRREATPEDLARSMVYFPVVGLIIGLILAGLNWLMAIVLPTAVVNLFLIVFLVVLTGALHLDGFVDTFDGIAGHKPVEDRWRVMHDSRAGAFGIVGVVLLLLAKYVSLNSIPWSLMMATLIFMPIVSRWAMVYTIFAYPYARPAGLGKAFKQGASWSRFIVATLITFAVAVALVPLFQLTGLVVMFGIWVITVLMATYFKSKFSGLTGDTYGAINEVAEVSTLVLIILLVQLGLA
ncbi:adenosylcobinamide-GDP ribazoletransferase [Chloroflexota bacterium]